MTRLTLLFGAVAVFGCASHDAVDPPALGDTRPRYAVGPHRTGVLLGDTIRVTSCSVTYAVCDPILGEGDAWSAWTLSGTLVLAANPSITLVDSARSVLLRAVDTGFVAIVGTFKVYPISDTAWIRTSDSSAITTVLVRQNDPERTLQIKVGDTNNFHAELYDGAANWYSACPTGAIIVDSTIASVAPGPITCRGFEVRGLKAGTTQLRVSFRGVYGEITIPVVP